MLIRENVRLAADWLAILAGVSFMLSALVQEAVFAMWGLDFTAIASVEDVVLGGVRFLAILIAYGVLFGVHLVLHELRHSVIAAKPGSGGIFIEALFDTCAVVVFLSVVVVM